MKSGFYGTDAWKRKRAAILKRDGYMDQLELRAGRKVPADTVHHIMPLDKYPQYKLASWNLISISNATHKELHTIKGNLSNAGERLMQETAHAHGIELSELTLIVGYPGTGKTTYAKEHLGGGVVYDLDYIAGAFRLKQAHKEDHKASRKMANSLAKAFAVNARKYSSKVLMIRTAPTIEEAEAYEPNRIVMLTKPREEKRYRLKTKEMEERLADLEDWANLNQIEFIKL